MNIQRYKTAFFWGGFGATVWLSSKSNCEAAVDTCPVDDPLGQIDYEIKERKTLAGQTSVRAYSCAVYRANRPLEVSITRFEGRANV